VEPASPFDPTDHVGIGTDRLSPETLATPPPAGSAADDLTLPAGTMLGDYRVVGEIGRGGMGIVLSAVHPLIGKRAAIKVLKKQLCADPSSVERFIDEARAANQIGHPNIVDVFAFGKTDDGRSYHVMEWLAGESLRARLARERMTLAEISWVVRSLCRALTAAHAKGVIHRDLKPDNVFLVEVAGEPPLVKLLDFGIAKLVRTDRQLDKTATGQLVGTPLYVAPEQAKGQQVDHRADIYSLGCMVFELLTGQLPFLAESAMEVVAKHLMEAAPRPSTLVAVPAELDDLVVAMLAKDPVQRPSLADVAAVVDRAEHDRIRRTSPMYEPERESYHSIAVTARRATPSVDDPSVRMRRRLTWVLPSIAIAGAAAAYVVVSALGGREPPARAPVTLPVAIPTPPPRPQVTPIEPAVAVDAGVAIAPPADAAVRIERPPRRVPHQHGGGPTPEAADGDAELLPLGSVHGGGK
jgi:serine/threonine-protein kinase